MRSGLGPVAPRSRSGMHAQSSPWRASLWRSSLGYQKARSRRCMHTPEICSGNFTPNNQFQDIESFLLFLVFFLEFLLDFLIFQFLLLLSGFQNLCFVCLPYWYFIQMNLNCNFDKVLNIELLMYTISPWQAIFRFYVWTFMPCLPAYERAAATEDSISTSEVCLGRLFPFGCKRVLVAQAGSPMSTNCLGHHVTLCLKHFGFSVQVHERESHSGCLACTHNEMGDFAT